MKAFAQLFLVATLFLSACQNVSITFTNLPLSGDTVSEPLVASATPQPADVPSEAPQPTPTLVVRDTDEDFSVVDRPDDVTGYQVHFVYAIPSDGKDDLLDVNGSIALSAAAMNSWLDSKTEHRLRYDTYQGQVDISYLPLDASADEISSLGTDILPYIEHQIKSQAADSSHKLYVVYYDGLFVTPEGYCGLAAYPPDGAGQTAVLLLRGYNPTYDAVCPRQFTKSEDYTGYFEMTILHEVLHLMGMVPACAPNNADGHVTDSSQDLMYYQYNNSYSPLYTYLDYHNNDYFNTGNADCPDLARSVFLDPLPQNAETPPGWDVSTRYLPFDPLDAN